MTDSQNANENIMNNSRRLSFTIAELDLIKTCLSPLTIEDGKKLRDRIDAAIQEEHDPKFRARVNAYRNAVNLVDGEIEMVVDHRIDRFQCGAYVLVWKWVDACEAGVCITCGSVYANNGEGYAGECGDCANKTFASDDEFDDAYWKHESQMTDLSDDEEQAWRLK